MPFIFDLTAFPYFEVMPKTRSKVLLFFEMDKKKRKKMEKMGLFGKK